MFAFREENAAELEHVRLGLRHDRERFAAACQREIGDARFAELAYIRLSLSHESNFEIEHAATDRKPIFKATLHGKYAQS